MSFLNVEAAIKLYDGGVYTVGTDNSVKLELKGSIPGGSLTAYVTDWNLMHYASKYAGPKVLMLVEGQVVLKAFVNEDGHGRPRLQGNVDILQRLHCRVNREWLPTLDECVADRPVTPKTEYEVRRFVASSWATKSVRVKGNHSLVSFCRPLAKMHEELIEDGEIDNEPLFAVGELPPLEDEMDEDASDVFSSRAQAQAEREERVQETRELTVRSFGS